MSYLKRSLDLELDELFPFVPAIAIDGPKAVGKTVTALRRADQVYYLDNAAQREFLQADFLLASLPSGTVLLDEWQQLPEIWNSVRRNVDEGAPSKRFLLTGSATPVDQSGTHSGAGRILSARMRPLTFYERYRPSNPVSLRGLLKGEQPVIEGSTGVTFNDYVKAIVEGGFPATLGQPDRVCRAYLDAYVQRIIDRDIPELGHSVRYPETLKRWMQAYAAASSSTASYSRILDATTAGDGVQPAKTTTNLYRNFLTKLWILDPVPGWAPASNEFTRLTVSPKHQLADPALAARLLQLSASTLTSSQGAHMLGPLFESLVTLSVRVAAQAAEATVSHLRTKNGDHEVDLIVQGPEGEVLGIEVKLAPVITDTDVRHLLWLRDKMPDSVTNLVVITTGTQAYRRADGVLVLPLSLLAE